MLRSVRKYDIILGDFPYNTCGARGEPSFPHDVVLKNEIENDATFVCSVAATGSHGLSSFLPYVFPMEQKHPRAETIEDVGADSEGPKKKRSHKLQATNHVLIYRRSRGV